MRACNQLEILIGTQQRVRNTQVAKKAKHWLDVLSCVPLPINSTISLCVLCLVCLLFFSISLFDHGTFMHKTARKRLLMQHCHHNRSTHRPQLTCVHVCFCVWCDAPCCIVRQNVACTQNERHRVSVQADCVKTGLSTRS